VQDTEVGDFLVIGRSRVCDFIGLNFFFAKKTFITVFRIRDVLIGIRIQDPRVRIVRSESCSLLVHRRIRIRTNNYGSRSGWTPYTDTGLMLWWRVCGEQSFVPLCSAARNDSLRSLWTITSKVVQYGCLMKILKLLSCSACKEKFQIFFEPALPLCPPDEISIQRSIFEPNLSLKRSFLTDRIFV
jgi:hypothetical protein